MPILIIDTSTEKLHLGLYSKESLIAWEKSSHGNQLSNFLLPSITSLLQAHLCSLRELEYIAVGTGPGSFTGTRLGVMVAMTLAFSIEIPTIGFPSTLLNEDRELLFKTIQEKFTKKLYDLEINYCPLTPDSSRIKAPELNK